GAGGTRAVEAHEAVTCERDVDLRDERRLDGQRGGRRGIRSTWGIARQLDRGATLVSARWIGGRSAVSALARGGGPRLVISRPILSCRFFLLARAVRLLVGLACCRGIA